jgi:hypothetical protein
VLRLSPEALNGVPGFSAKCTVIRSESGYELELETLYGERHGSRRMRDVSCVELTRAAAVVIALAIRPDGAAREETQAAPPGAQQKSSQPPAEIPPSPRPSTTKVAPAKALEPAQQPFELWLTAAFAGELGTLPGFAPGAMFGLEARADWVRFGISAEILPTQSTAANQPGDPALAVEYVGADAVGCVGLPRDRLLVGGCAGVGMGRLHGESRDTPIGGEGSTLWVTPRLGAFLLYRVLPVLSLEAAVNARFATKDASFNVEGYGPVYETDPVALLITAGPSLRIW